MSRASPFSFMAIAAVLVLVIAYQLLAPITPIDVAGARAPVRVVAIDPGIVEVRVAAADAVAGHREIRQDAA